MKRISQADESSSKESIIESVEPEKSSESVANKSPMMRCLFRNNVDQVEDEGVDEPIQLEVRNLSTVRAQTQSILCNDGKISLSDNYERI